MLTRLARGLAVTAALVATGVSTAPASGEAGGPESLVHHALPSQPGALPLPDVAEPPAGQSLVFAPDDRVLVAEPTAWPYAAIAKVHLRFPNGRRFEASAVMVGPRHAMTAGHAVFDSTQGGWAETVRVLPAFASGNAPFGSAYATDLYSTEGWVSIEDVEHDFGVIEFDRNLGNKGGWLPFTTATDGELVGEDFEVAGYPADRSGGNRQYTATGPVHAVSDFEMFYRATLDTYGGQSGSPVLRGRGAEAEIVGIHTFGTQETNGGVRITQAVADLTREVLGSESVVPSEDVLDEPLVWRKWNRVALADDEGAVYRFVLDNDVLESGEPVRRLRIKVRPRTARGVVEGPRGEIFTVHPGKAVRVREPSEGQWTVRLFLEETDRPRKARVRVKPSARP